MSQVPHDRPASVVAPTRRAVLAGAAAGLAAGALPPRAARAADPVRLAVLTDQSGPYADAGGRGSVQAARMAVADFGPTVLGLPVEILEGDTQNKPDVAAALARRWYDGGVDAVLDLPVTPVGLAVQQVAREKGRTVMINGAAVTDFTTRTCFPLSSHWADDVHALTAGTAHAVLGGGGRSWFFITVDFAFGTAVETLATQIIRQEGGTVLGSARYPLGNADFSSQLLAAQSSGAEVIGLASVGQDQVNLIKQAAEFGVAPRQRLAGFLVYVTDVHALGLKAAQGLAVTSGFYWDQNDEARAFGKRFMAAQKAMPTREQASVYAAVTQFLRAMAKAGTRDPVAVNRAMRAEAFSFFGRPASVRGDGRVLYDLELWRVKAPGESTGEWDLYAPVAGIPAAEAFAAPVAGCLAG